MFTRLTFQFCYFVLVCAASIPLSAQKFVAGCAYPWGDLAESHPIDKTCSINGASKVPQKVAESKLKNHLCATGAPTAIDYQTLIDLQKAVENDPSIHLGNRETPDRPMKAYDTDKGSLKEGNLITLAAWVIVARNSDLSSGENVNCNAKKDKASNDIHIVLAQLVSHSDIDEEECDSETAEAIPHGRPTSWSTDNINSFRDHPFRFTGQLFLDSDHTPCSNGKGSPARASVWEIHPLYQIEVCKFTSAAKCSPTSDTAWTPLNEWVEGGTKK